MSFVTPVQDPSFAPFLRALEFHIDKGTPAAMRVRKARSLDVMGEIVRFPKCEVQQALKSISKAASKRRSSRGDFFSSSRIANLLDACAHQALNSSTILLIAGIATFIAALFFGPLNAICAGGLLLFFLRQSRKERADAIRCGELWIRCYEISLPLNTTSAITDDGRRDEAQAGISRMLADKVFPDGNAERPTLTSRMKRHFLRKVS